jgi:transposase
MLNVTVIGVDIAKNVIQIHGADEKGKGVLKKRISRENFLSEMSKLPKCLVGMEACGGSNYWARELKKLGFDAKQMPPLKVKKYADHQKNDARDAAACAEAVTRESMIFVPPKTEEQLKLQRMHRARSFYVKQKTGLMNMIRGFLLEMGIAIPQGESALYKGLDGLSNEKKLDEESKLFIENLYESLKALNKNLETHDSELRRLAKVDKQSVRLQTIEGIGPLTATALTAKIGNGIEFHKGRDLSAYLGLVPKQNSSGDKQSLGGITKHGDKYIRQLLIHGGRSVVQASKRVDKKTGAYIKQDAHSEWVESLLYG